MNGHFLNLQEAVDSASAGDIIYVYSSAAYYGNATINKTLTIIGSGYNIPDNMDSTGIMTYLASARVGSLTFQDDADGSIVLGLDIISHIALNDNVNMFVQRNKIAYSIIMTNTTQSLIAENNLHGNTAIGPEYDKLIIRSGCSGILVSNNIFDQYNTTSSNQYDNVSMSSSSSATFTNNIFRDRVFTSYCSFKNNIFLNDYYPSLTTNVVEFNVLTGSNVSIPSSNVTGVNKDSIFVGYEPQGSYSFDNRFYLKPNSPAKSAGQNGIDAGVFSTESPYKLSGIPFVPLISEINAPTSATSGGGLPVTIKARAEN